jgi:hypothetical protein
MTTAGSLQVEQTVQRVQLQEADTRICLSAFRLLPQSRVIFKHFARSCRSRPHSVWPADELADQVCGRCVDAGLGDLVLECHLVCSVSTSSDVDATHFRTRRQISYRSLITALYIPATEEVGKYVSCTKKTT